MPVQRNDDSLLQLESLRNNAFNEKRTHLLDEFMLNVVDEWVSELIENKWLKDK